MALIARQLLSSGGGVPEESWYTSLGASDRQRLYSCHADGKFVYVAGDLRSGGVNYALIGKLDKTGAQVWSRSLGDGTGQQFLAVTGGKGDDIYACGASGNYGLLARYDRNGALQWQKLFGSGGNCDFRAVCVDSSGNVFVAGSYGNAGVVVKYNSSGALQWQRGLGTAAGDSCALYGLRCDGSGNVYVSGGGSSTTDATTYGYSLLAKYNTSGSIQWQRRLGGGNLGDPGTAYAVTIDASDNVYAAGTSVNSVSGTIAKYDTSGAFAWDKLLSTVGSDLVRFNGASFDSGGNIYVTGTNTTAGGDSVVYAKYNSSGSLQFQRLFRATSGGPGERGGGIAVDLYGRAYIAGETSTVGAGNIDGLILRLRNDGTPTGTYGGLAYFAAAYTDQGVGATEAASNLTGTTTTYADATGTLTAASLSLTDTKTSIA